MQSFESAFTCPDCLSTLVDAGDEYVCPSCGVVSEKEVIVGAGQESHGPLDGGSGSLGSFLGSVEVTNAERHSIGFSKSNSTYRYLKTISDFGGREDRALYDCSRLLERVAEKLSLPKVVALEGGTLARKVLSTAPRSKGVTLAAVAAYALVAACRMEGVTSVSVREVLETFNLLGRRVKMSSMIRLSIESPLDAPSRRPEDYVPRVVSHLFRNHDPGWTLDNEYLSCLRSTAVQVLVALPEDARAGHRPGALAATAVYSAELLLAKDGSRRKRITQGDAARSAGIAEYTVREQYREIFGPVIGCPEFQRSRTGTPPLEK